MSGSKTYIALILLLIPASSRAELFEKQRACVGDRLRGIFSKVASGTLHGAALLALAASGSKNPTLKPSQTGKTSSDSEPLTPSPSPSASQASLEKADPAAIPTTLPPPPPEAVPSPVPTASPRPMAELVAEARGALQGWKDLREAQPISGELFVHGEMAGLAPAMQSLLLPAALEGHDRDVKSVEAFLEGTQDRGEVGAFLALSAKLRQERLRHYCRDYGKLSDLYGNACGNCDSQTKFLISALTRAGVKIPEGYVLGVQVYGDHVRPVLHLKGSGTVIDLVYGKVETEVTAPIYQPLVLYQAFLDGINEASPVDAERDLLIHPGMPVKEGEAKAGSGLKTSSTLKYRMGRHRFAEGEIPETADLAQAATEPRGSNSARVANADEDLFNPKRMVAMRSEKSETGTLKDFAAESTRPGAVIKLIRRPEGAGYNKVFVFQDPAKVEAFERRPTAVGKGLIYAQAIREALDRFGRSPGRRLMFQFLRDPESVRRFSEKEIAQVIEALNFCDKSSDLGSTDFKKYFGPDFPEEIGRNLVRHPALQGFNEAAANYDQRLGQAPLQTLNWADHLPPEARAAFFRINHALRDLWVTVFGKDRFREVFQAALDPAQVGIREDDQNRRLLDTHRITWVNLDRWRNSAAPPKDRVLSIELPRESQDHRKTHRDGRDQENSEGRQRQNTTSPPLHSPAKTRPKLVVDPHTMLELLLTNPGDLGEMSKVRLLERYTPALHELYLKEYEANGKYDQRFLSTLMSTTYLKSLLYRLNFKERRAQFGSDRLMGIEIEFEKMAGASTNPPQKMLGPYPGGIVNAVVRAMQRQKPRLWKTLRIVPWKAELEQNLQPYGMGSMYPGTIYPGYGGFPGASGGVGAPPK